MTTEEMEKTGRDGNACTTQLYRLIYIQDPGRIAGRRITERSNKAVVQKEEHPAGRESLMPGIEVRNGKSMPKIPEGADSIMPGIPEGSADLRPVIPAKSGNPGLRTADGSAGPGNPVSDIPAGQGHPASGIPVPENAGGGDP